MPGSGRGGGDPASRRPFWLYWAPMSAGIILIRYAILPMLKREAERQARLEKEQTHGGSR